jgi:hypothetical protein
MSQDQATYGEGSRDASLKRALDVFEAFLLEKATQAR